MESSVEIAAPSGNPAAVVRTKLFTFGALPAAGPVTAQPPSPSSKDVVAPVETAVSSMNTPSPCVAQSLTYAIETSTCLPAKVDRSTDHCCQPPELPEAAFQEPVDPVGEHVVSAFSVW